MHYEVSLLREEGRRLRPGEKPRKERGCLTIGFEEPRCDTAIPRRVAILWTLDRWSSGQNRRTLLGPLFKPRMISLDDDAVLTIAGIEMRSTNEGTFEHNQVWRCRPLNGERVRSMPTAIARSRDLASATEGQVQGLSGKFHIQNCSRPATRADG